MTVIADDAAVHDIGGIMGGEHSGVSRDDHRRADRMRLFRSRADRARPARSWPDQRRAHAVRARRRSGVPRRRPRDRDAAGARHLRRRRRATSTRAGAPPLATAHGRLRSRRCAETLGGLAVAPSASSDDPRAARLRGRRATGRSPSRPGAATSTAPADLVEEVIRIDGLDNVARVAAAARADGVARPTATPAQKLERRVRRAAAARGLNEAVTWSFLVRGRGRARSAAAPGRSPTRSART